MTAKLWVTMLEDISQITMSRNVSFTFIQKLAKTPKQGVNKLLLAE
jgi:DNA polymerase-3 subunit epsilon